MSKSLPDSPVMGAKRKTILICCGGAVIALLNGVALFVFFSQTMREAPMGKAVLTASTTRQMMTYSEFYRSVVGFWPPGDGAQLLRSFAGDNPKHFAFCELKAFRVNRKGESIDAWGTAVKVSFEGDHAHAVSAGKDKLFGTSDDIIGTY